MTNIKRRPVTVPVRGQPVKIYAPGLKVMRRRNGALSLYWVADEAAVKKGYPTKTRAIFADLEDDSCIGFIEETCQAEQASMLAWLDGSIPTETPRLRFDGTLASLVSMYESDEDSAFQDLKSNSATSYGDGLKIIRETVGARRVDRLVAKDFRRWYKNWRQPEFEDSEPRVRRAYGCIQMLRVVLGYGIEAGIDCCRKLKSDLQGMRFARNPPRDKVVTYAQAEAFIKLAIKKGELSIALAQALQFECFLRQSEIVGHWRKEPAKYRLRPGEVRHGDLVWSGLTWDQVSLESDLRIRTSKTGQPVVHVLEKCPLVVKCLEATDVSTKTGPILTRKDGLPWIDRRSFGRQWRELATEAGIPKDVWNRDVRASGISEAAEAGASDDDLARGAAHADKAITRNTYQRIRRASSVRVQESRIQHRRKERQGGE